MDCNLRRGPIHISKHRFYDKISNSAETSFRVTMQIHSSSKYNYNNTVLANAFPTFKTGSNKLKLKMPSHLKHSNFNYKKRQSQGCKLSGSDCLKDNENLKKPSSHTARHQELPCISLSSVEQNTEAHQYNKCKTRSLKKEQQ